MLIKSRVTDTCQWEQPYQLPRGNSYLNFFLVCTKRTTYNHILTYYKCLTPVWQFGSLSLFTEHCNICFMFYGSRRRREGGLEGIILCFSLNYETFRFTCRLQLNCWNTVTLFLWEALERSILSHFWILDNCWRDRKKLYKKVTAGQGGHLNQVEKARQFLKGQLKEIIRITSTYWEYTCSKTKIFFCQQGI